MSDSPNTVMWSYEAEFLASVEINARTLFSSLDMKLSPLVLLIGFNSKMTANQPPIYIVSADMHLKAHDFSSVPSDALAIDVDENLVQTGRRQITQSLLIQRMEALALHQALHNKLNALKTSHQMVSFCSLPVAVGDYMVSVILQFETYTYEEHYELQHQETVSGHRVATSLYNAAAKTFLDECTDALSRPRPRSLRRERAEILQAAGKNFMLTPATKADPFLGSKDLFDACRNIATLRYEGAESVGMMLVSRRDHPAIEPIVLLEDSINIDSYRAVRKMLEISSADLSLLCDSARIYGFGRLKASYIPQDEDLFVVRFTRHHQWELLHNNHLLMQVTYGQPGMRKQRIDSDKFKRYVKRLFPSVKQHYIENLWQVVKAASQQEHGTIVVISEEASEEADRLQTQSIRIKPIRISPSMMLELSIIDGAVLIDPKSRCYAIGVILDGLASVKGDPSRGSRYNSAVKYVESVDHACLAVVVSADGYIDLIPDLIPPIKQSDLISAVERLQKAYNADEIMVEDYQANIDWLRAHKDYLWPEITDEINILKHALEERISRQTGQVELDVEPDFEANSEVEGSFFIDESGR